MHAHLIHPLTPIARDAGCDARVDRPVVLIADGDADVHAIFGAALERECFRVIHAYSEAECLRLAGTRPVRAALVSVGWCGLFTWRRLHDLATAAASGGFVIVCLTTDPRLSPHIRRRPPGATMVLMLPCIPTVLAAEVRRAVRDHGRAPN
jgi:DNA-binding response OmpR family regulator